MVEAEKQVIVISLDPECLSYNKVKALLVVFDKSVTSLHTINHRGVGMIMTFDTQNCSKDFVLFLTPCMQDCSWISPTRGEPRA